MFCKYCEYFCMARLEVMNTHVTMPAINTTFIFIVPKMSNSYCSSCRIEVEKYKVIK